MLPHDSPALQLLQRVRDEAHRFAIEFHRGRRDKAMTRSVLDELPGVGPARKRLLLQHFGSPERFLQASREELEAVPGVPGKVARESTSTSTRSGERTRARCQPDIDDFVVITGFSGAGKSQAMAAFEDAGYFCVDNLPPEMIASLAELFAHEGSKVERAAVVCDVRGGAYFEGIVRGARASSRSAACAHRVLFLDASADVLMRPLQGDPPPPPARQRRPGHRRRSSRSGRCSSRCASSPTS